MTSRDPQETAGQPAEAGPPPVDKLTGGPGLSRIDLRDPASPQRLRAQGHEMPNAIIALGPVTHFRFENYALFNEQALLGIVYDAAFAGFMRGAYVHYDQWDHPHVSPMNGNLVGYPPTMLVVGTHDGMIDSARAFAGKLREAGNRHVDLYVQAGMPYGFSFFPGLFQQEDEAFAEVGRFISRHLLAVS